MEIDDKLIAYLEDLSYLALSDAEKPRLKKDIHEMIDSITQLTTLDTEGVVESSHPLDDVNAFREDVPGAPFGKDLILQNAPECNDEMFIVPRALE